MKQGLEVCTLRRRFFFAYGRDAIDTWEDGAVRDADFFLLMGQMERVLQEYELYKEQAGSKGNGKDNRYTGA